MGGGWRGGDEEHERDLQVLAGVGYGAKGVRVSGPNRCSRKQRVSHVQLWLWMLLKLPWSTCHDASLMRVSGALWRTAARQVPFGRTWTHPVCTIAASTVQWLAAPHYTTQACCSASAVRFHPVVTRLLPGNTLPRAIRPCFYAGCGIQSALSSVFTIIPSGNTRTHTLTTHTRPALLHTAPLPASWHPVVCWQRSVLTLITHAPPPSHPPATSPGDPPGSAVSSTEEFLSLPRPPSTVPPAGSVGLVEPAAAVGPRFRPGSAVWCAPHPDGGEGAAPVKGTVGQLVSADGGAGGQALYKVGGGEVSQRVEREVGRYCLCHEPLCMQQHMVPSLHGLVGGVGWVGGTS